MNPIAQISLKIFFGLWGLLGIVLHLLKVIKDYNRFHPDNPIKTPKQMMNYITSDLPGLFFSMLCYVVIWGIWCSFFQLSKQITGEQFKWLAEFLFVAGNPWAGIGMVFIGFSSDSVWNKAAQKFDQEINRRLGVVGGPSNDQPPLPPPPPPTDDQPPLPPPPPRG